MDEGTSKSSAAVASDGCRVLPSRNDAHDDDMQLSRKQRRLLVEASCCCCASKKMYSALAGSSGSIIIIISLWIDHINNIIILSRDVFAPDALQKRHCSGLKGKSPF